MPATRIHPFRKPGSSSGIKKSFLLLSFFFIIFSTANAQLEVEKMIGKNSKNSTIGYGTFAFWDFPLNETGNRSLVIELLDFGYFPQKHSEIESVIGYLSIKAGYKYIFSEETKTGFYIEPAAGYCLVINSAGPNGTNRNGIALACELGYTVEVGRGDNNLNFGLKYETDQAGGNTTMSAIAFRFSYSFHLFRRRG